MYERVLPVRVVVLSLLIGGLLAGVIIFAFLPDLWWIGVAVILASVVEAVVMHRVLMRRLAPADPQSELDRMNAEAEARSRQAGDWSRDV